jgi:hypothetical protein
MWAGVRELVYSLGHQITSAYKALTDPHNMIVIAYSIVLLALTAVAFSLLISNYDALLRLAHIHMSCQNLSNHKAASLAICGVIFGVSTPLTIGEAVLIADAKRKGRPHSALHLMVFAATSITSGGVLVSLAIGFC